MYVVLNFITCVAVRVKPRVSRKSWFVGRSRRQRRKHPAVPIQPTKAPDGCLCFMNCMAESTIPIRRKRVVVVPGFDPQAQPVVESQVLRPLAESTLDSN